MDKDVRKHWRQRTLREMDRPGRVGESDDFMRFRHRQTLLFESSNMLLRDHELMIREIRELRKACEELSRSVKALREKG